jgi:hypothetical protein
MMPVHSAGDRFMRIIILVPSPRLVFLFTALALRSGAARR